MTIATPAVLFDLDGTLVDPNGGITGGVAYALQAMGLPVPGDDVLARMVGPKLSDSLLAFTEATAEQVPAVIAEYRKWYGAHGISLSRVYPGMEDLLAALRSQGRLLGVATQKPEPLARTVLEHHGLDGYFDVICGSPADENLMPGDPGYRSGKTEIIAAAIEALDVESAVMIGDRAHDARGAQANAVPCIGVSWGFAAEGELADAGVSALVGDAGQLAQALEGLAFLPAGNGALDGAL